MIKIQPLTDKIAWEQFVLSSPQGSFLQSWNWGEFNQSLGHKIFRLGFYQQNKLRGVVLLIKKLARRGSYLECPAGPIIPWQPPSYFAAFVAEVKKIAQQQRVAFVRVRPNILDTDRYRSILRQQQFIPAPMHLHAQTTWVLDITPSAEDLLKNMRKTTRYSIRKAQKLGVKIEKSIAEKDIEILYRLQLETVKRHKFTPFPKKYFLQQLRAFKADNQIQLFKAVYRQQVLAISFIIFYGQEAIYHYSGSSSRMGQIPASYLLQWQAIREAKQRGLKRYNFWGIAKTDNPKHRFAGVTRFKKGFGGYRLDLLPAHDLPVNFFYWPVYFFETFRKYQRHL